MVTLIFLIGFISVAAQAAPQTTTLKALLPFESKQYYGSVIDANSEVTTLAIACPAGVNPKQCGIPPGQTIIQGPYTWSMSAENKELYGDFDGRCQLDPVRDVMTCVLLTLTGTKNSGYITETTSRYSSLMVPVTITAGAEKLVNTNYRDRVPSQSSPTAPAARSSSTPSIPVATGRATALPISPPKPNSACGASTGEVARRWILFGALIAWGLL